MHTHTPHLFPPQSVTVPLQGFLNAMVYGWTREDFLNVMAKPKESSAANPAATGTVRPKNLMDSADKSVNHIGDSVYLLSTEGQPMNDSEEEVEPQETEFEDD